MDTSSVILMYGHYTLQYKINLNMNDIVYPTIATYTNEPIIIDYETIIIDCETEDSVCINIMSEPEPDTIILIEDVISERTNCCVYRGMHLCQWFSCISCILITFGIVCAGIVYSIIL
jgi:hypothetical protein